MIEKKMEITIMSILGFVLGFTGVTCGLYS